MTTINLFAACLAEFGFEHEGGSGETVVSSVEENFKNRVVFKEEYATTFDSNWAHKKGS